MSKRGQSAGMAPSNGAFTVCQALQTGASQNPSPVVLTAPGQGGPGLLIPTSGLFPFCHSRFNSPSSCLLHSGSETISQSKTRDPKSLVLCPRSRARVAPDSVKETWRNRFGLKFCFAGLTLLSLSFPISKMGVIIAPTSQGRG